MKSHNSYSNFVEHPRYGKRPRITGLNPQSDSEGHVFFRWDSPEAFHVPNTAITANLSKQTPATVAVTHYFDVIRKCRDCNKSFIFFAEEQKYWYEELGFGLESECVRCVICRKAQQNLDYKRQRYEELFHIPKRNTQENLEMAECCLSLVEANVFRTRQTQRIRMLLKQSSEGLDESTQSLYDESWSRLLLLEAQYR